MDEEEYSSFFETLCKDPEMWNLYDELEQSKNALYPHLESPSEKTEQYILAEAGKVALGFSPNAQAGIKTSRPVFSWLKFPRIYTFSMSIVLIAGLYYWNHSDSTLTGSTGDTHSNFSENQDWIRNRLNRMEDDRVLPLRLDDDKYSLVKNSGHTSGIFRNVSN